ncbi:hypothetical protein CDAR_456341 [Caerostris darwini]|uniref:Uncharacterized protein n=1 Tax=Caerostris darwini TaxID=1538125 RepID=A0AAV4QDZ6_9ARAC|nr:hypothetical protein CDAR_456341 [Caerostris darwini]
MTVQANACLINGIKQKEKGGNPSTWLRETPQRINFQKTTLEYEFLVIIIATVFLLFLVATQKKFMERREEKRSVRKKEDIMGKQNDKDTISGEIQKKEIEENISYFPKENISLPFHCDSPLRTRRACDGAYFNSNRVASRNVSFYPHVNHPPGVAKKGSCPSKS